MKTDEQKNSKSSQKAVKSVRWKDENGEQSAIYLSIGRPCNTRVRGVFLAYPVYIYNYSYH